MKKSAGILLYRKATQSVEVLLVHPGGPFWKNKDVGAWSIPKGEFEDGEIALDAAIREFKEETGFEISGEFIGVSSSKMKSGKMIYAWALEKDLDAQAVKSNEFEMVWPPSSGKKISVPEIDRAEWFDTAEALKRINPAQAIFITRLTAIINAKG